VAGTPAMVMTGSATAPLIGGIMVQLGGYTLLGIVAASVSVTACVLFAASSKAQKAAVSA
ncbi:MAG: MFS transporter, partial [Pseudomonadota bacterium]